MRVFGIAAACAARTNPVADAVGRQRIIIPAYIGAVRSADDSITGRSLRSPARAAVADRVGRYRTLSRAKTAFDAVFDPWRISGKKRSLP